MKNAFKFTAFLFMIVCIAVGCMVACDSSDDVDEPPCNHKWVEVSNTATCQSDGIKTFKCSVCNISRSEESDIGDHVERIVDAVEPTCTEYGKTAGKVCDICGEVLVKQETVPPAHKEVVLPAVQPTCTENGLTEGLGCSVCGVVFKSQKTVKASHTVEIIPSVEMTCTTDGYTEGTQCSVCGEILEAPTLIEHSHGALEHVWGYAATCTEDGITDGKRCSRCRQMVEEQTVIPAAHKEKVIAGYAATCTEDGLTDGKSCSVCGTVLVEQQKLEAHHTPVTVKGYAVTCSSHGMSDGEKCSTCGKIFVSQYTLMSNGHDFDAEGKCKNCDIEVTDGLDYAPYASSHLPPITSSEVTAYYVTGFKDGYGRGVTTIVIPSKYNGGVVVGIGDRAFENCATVKGIILPGTIISVGKNAFKGCSSLESVECPDFSQTENWHENWCGDVESIKISAMLQGGQTPYEIYIYAMTKIGHNYDKYVFDASTLSSIVDGGITADLFRTDVHLEQYLRDFYQKVTTYDYQSSSLPSESFSETWYYNCNLYSKLDAGANNKGSACVTGVSYEYLLGMSMVEDVPVPEITEEYFKDVKFYKDTDGKLKLECIMDGERVKDYLNIVPDVSIPTDTVELSSVTGKYVFGANGAIESCFGDIMWSVKNSNSFLKTSTSMTFREVGTFAGIDDPSSKYSWQHKGSSSGLAQVLCKSGHTVVEVPEIPATCFGSGTTSFSYCSQCYQAITKVETIKAGHYFENGECTVCGAFEDENTSRGLAYMLKSDESGYVVVGIGECRDTDVYIPDQIYGLTIVGVNADAFDGTNVQNVTVGGRTYAIDEFEGWALK